jgi:hypothetical protein
MHAGTHAKRELTKKKQAEIQHSATTPLRADAFGIPSALASDALAAHRQHIKHRVTHKAVRHSSTTHKQQREDSPKKEAARECKGHATIESEHPIRS